jgi:hypothetical protein
MASAALKKGAERSKAWADVNKMIVAQAPGIPYSWDDTFSLASKDLAAVGNAYFNGWDFSFTSLK